MKILVTGAKGMIGSHLVTALLAEGYEVVGVDRAGEDSRSKMLSFFKADLADREGLCRIMDENGVDRVIHLAALAHTDGEPDLSWERYYHINVEYVFTALNFNRTTTTASVRFAQFHLNAFQTIYPTLFVAQNANRVVQKA